MGTPVKISPEIRELELESYLLELEVDGLTVVPPEVHGFGLERVDQMVDLILERARQLTGSEFTLDQGPLEKLEFRTPERPGLGGREAEKHEQSQFLIQQLARYHRVFRDLAINPAAVALIKQMVGPNATRFSSHNCFVKWKGEYGYGPSLGLHADQMAVPPPWGRAAYTANTNWCLTDYTLEGGALAYVPGSHRFVARPAPDAVAKAVAVEAPRGSVIVFHGATWHGAFPRKLPGMRLSVANYYRHMMVTSQEDIVNGFPRELAEDCDNPDMFRALAGFSDPFPYAEPNQPLPWVAEGGLAAT